MKLCNLKIKKLIKNKLKVEETIPIIFISCKFSFKCFFFVLSLLLKKCLYITEAIPPSANPNKKS